MQFAAIIYQSEKLLATMTQEEWAKIFGEYQVLTKELSEKKQLLGGQAVQPVATAKTLRHRGKIFVTDGPAFQTEDELSAINILEAPDIEAAIAIAAKFPSARWGRIEVRPLRVYTNSKEGPK